MVKVLIYGSKEIYESSSYEGRAEADIVAYAVTGAPSKTYNVLKDRTGKISRDIVYGYENMMLYIEWAETAEIQCEVDALLLKRKYKGHPLMELSKNNDP